MKLHGMILGGYLHDCSIYRFSDFRLSDPEMIPKVKNSNCHYFIESMNFKLHGMILDGRPHA